MANPKRVVKAFLPEPITVGTLKLQPFTVGTVLLLERLDHPLMDDKAKADMTNDEVMTLVYVLTRPVAESNALYQKSPDDFAAAVLDFAAQIPLAELRPLGEAIRRHFADAVATVMPLGGAPEKKVPPAP